MTDAWDGRPENPERDGWHWLASSEGPVPALWARPAWRHCRDFWISQAEPEWMVRQGWRYLGPCLMPAEVEASVAEARREALEEAVRLADMYGTGKDGIRASRIIRDAIRELKERGDE